MPESPQSPNDETPDGVTDAGPSAQQINDQLERILQSNLVKGSLTLHRLLRFIIQTTIEGRHDEVKESVIAVAVFDRSADFDNRVDPVVRVQAHRLRRKLDAYYEGPGAQDPIVIKIPKGSYVPEIRRRDGALLAPAGPTPEPLHDADPRPAADHSGPEVRRFPRSAWLAVVTGLLVGYLWGAGGVGRSTLGAVGPRTRALWDPFLAKDAAPTAAVFSVPVFLSNDKALLRYTGPFTAPTGAGLTSPEDLRQYVDPELLESVGPVLFNRTYAYLGQVYQVHALTRLFTQAGKSLQLRPRRVVTPDESEGRNLLLLTGAGLELAKQELLHFRFRSGAFGYKSANQPVIVNISPQPGEESEYGIGFDQQTQERKVDHAILAFLPGRQPGLSVVYTDGLTTLANWAAIRAATSEEGIAQLVSRLGVERPRYFEAVVRADINQDQVSEFEVVAARVR